MKFLAILFGLGLSWCGPITTQHHDTALEHGGQIERAQAMACAPVLGLLRCDVYHPYGEPIEMWCDAQTCEYVTP